MKRIFLLSVVILQLSACAGGGGGSGASPGASSPYGPGPGSSYGTPIKVATLDPLVNQPGTGFKAPIYDTFAADITGNGQDIIIAGRMTQGTSPEEWGNSRIHMLGWQNGTIVDRTAQWFPNGINEILGTEPSVKFADFFKSGRTDMFVAPSTDMQHYGPAVIFTNQGNRFTRQDIALTNVWAHDSAVADLNGDTYKDIVLTDYGPNTTMLINNRVDSFTAMTDRRGIAGDLRHGGSGIAVADFLQNSTNQLIITDNTCNTIAVGCGSSSTKMYTWSIDQANRDVTYTWHSDLPAPRFFLPKWSGHGFTGNHSVRISAFDFSDDGVPDAIVFSMPRGGHGGDNRYSEIQFLKNNGAGNFTDVTDTTLVGYDHKTWTTYNPKFIDVNGDGRTDILVSAFDAVGHNSSHQFLLKSSDGKYVSAYQNILTSFATDVNRLQNTENSANSVNLVRGPDGKLFLVSAASFMNGSDHQLAVYMSPLGNQNTTTVQTAIQLMQTAWPYMTQTQIAQTLATTSLAYTTSAGTGYLLDLEKIMQPFGTMSLNSASGMRPISGLLTGVDIGNGQAVAMDQLGRGFNLNLKNITSPNTPNSFMVNTAHINEHSLSSHAEHLVGGPVYNVNGVRFGADTRSTNANGDNSQMLGRNAGMIPQQYTVGIPNFYKNGRASLGVQYTSLNSNPWIYMSGAWGQVNNSGILDHVFSWRDGGFSVQKGIMYTTTNITPGLVTNITPITSLWAESGYRFSRDGFGDLGVYAGVKPVIVSGSVEANIPTAVDNSGNTVYSKRNLALQNPVTGYARVMYTNRVNKETQYRFTAMATQYGQYRFMHELRWNLN
jgi:hypothetical protein